MSCPAAVAPAAASTQDFRHVPQLRDLGRWAWDFGEGLRGRTPRGSEHGGRTGEEGPKGPLT